MSNPLIDSLIRHLIALPLAAGLAIDFLFADSQNASLENQALSQPVLSISNKKQRLEVAAAAARHSKGSEDKLSTWLRTQQDLLACMINLIQVHLKHPDRQDYKDRFVTWVKWTVKSQKQFAPTGILQPFWDQLNLMEYGMTRQTPPNQMLDAFSEAFSRLQKATAPTRKAA